jgi:hypothetical protein
MGNAQGGALKSATKAPTGIVQPTTTGWQKVSIGPDTDQKKHNQTTKAVVIAVSILALLIFGALIAMLVVYSTESGTPDNAIEIFDLDFTPIGTLISQHSGHIVCYGSQEVNFYRLAENGESYVRLPHSDIVWGPTEEIVGGEIGDGIVTLVVQSISTVALKPDSPGDSSRLLVFDLQADNATQLVTPYALSDGEMLTGGVAVNNLDNTIVVGVLANFGNLEFTLYGLEYDGSSYVGVHTLAILPFVTSTMGAQITASQLTFTILDPTEDTQGVCRIYNFQGLNPGVLIATLSGGEVPRTDTEFGLSDHDMQLQLESVSINDTGRILFCVATDRLNPYDRRVVLFSRDNETVPFWNATTRGIFAQRTILPEDVASDIRISERGSYFAVSFPTSRDSPFFQLFVIDPDDAQLTQTRPPTEVIGFGTKFNTNALLGISMGASLLGQSTPRIAAISPIEKSLLYFDADFAA